jgi:UrcA family protein
MLSDKMISLLAACAVTITGLAIAVPAVAREPKPVVVTGPAPDANLIRRYVSYRDLNLATAMGKKVLVKRVGVAVREVCDEATEQSARISDLARCSSASWRDARPQIDRAVLRARQIATNGWSAIAPVTITLSIDY